MLADIRIVGAIDEESYVSFCTQLDAIENIRPISKRPKNITVEIVSAGGSANIAFAFVGRMRLSPLLIKTIGNGYVASAATLILAAGAFRVVTKETTLMVHEDHGGIEEATVSQIEQYASNMRFMEDKWNVLLASFCKGNATADTFTKLHKLGDSNLTPQEALDLGMIDDVI